jgi:hypothetical protein
MAFTTCSVATNNIASLDNLPNDVGGLTPAQLKAVFDKFGVDLVAWFNATHIVEDDAHLAEKAAAGTLGHIKIGAGLSIDVNGIVTAGAFKVGSFTRDTSLASGTQAITGVGFQPRAVILLASVDGTPEVSIGFTDGVTSGVIYNYHNVTANAWTVYTSIIALVQSAIINLLGTLSSLDADGFTISWVKTGAKTGTATIKYMAIR